MFDFMDDLSTLSKALIAGTAALGIATLWSRHDDKKQVAALMAAANEEAAGTQQVVDPTVPMAPAGAAVAPQPQI